MTSPFKMKARASASGSHLCPDVVMQQSPCATQKGLEFCTRPHFFSFFPSSCFAKAICCIVCWSKRLLLGLLSNMTIQSSSLLMVEDKDFRK